MHSLRKNVSLLHAHVVYSNFGVRHTMAVAGLGVGFAAAIPAAASRSAAHIGWELLQAGEDNDRDISLYRTLFAAWYQGKSSPPLSFRITIPKVLNTTATFPIPTKQMPTSTPIYQYFV